MPGILPMKVIKVGNSAQSRIAQACDRCRSKKIRCDGVRPTCSQCANVGFECRTSDKLSRRAFPRGYTESLEERIRQLETEVRELKDLLDEKDEKMDMLAAMYGNHRRPPPSIPSARHTSSSSPETASKESPGSLPKRDSFRVQGSPLLLGVENSDSYFMGPSSGRSFIVSFKQKLQELGKSCRDFNPEAFLHVQGCAPLLTPEERVPASRPPPRIFSDRCVNVFFQELAPLFPVLHKPSFLRIYEEFVSDPGKVRCRHKIAQLHLVFCIAGISSEKPDLQEIAVCEQRWSQAVESLVLENTLSTLQCLILALLYCTLRADNKRVQHFKGLAVGLSHRLGLHQSQKRFSFGLLTLETRKKVFWTLYTLDCFSSATLGLPKLLREEDVETEYPSDVDDEYITENGFQPCLPGEHTRLSSALALFRLSRILARILDNNYPARANHELSLQQMSSLDAELDAWYDDLPAHLRLTFSQDKPSTDITSSRSPLLSLAFYHARTLIYRPAVGSSLGAKAAPALLSIADASKRITQIIQLLEERSMSFAFCLNKFDVLALCGLTLLYQAVELKQDSKLTRDIERLVNVAVKTLNDAKAPGCVELSRVAGKIIVLDAEPCPSPSLRGSGLGPPQRAASKGSRKTAEACRQQEAARRVTVPTIKATDEISRRLGQSFDRIGSGPPGTQWDGGGMSVPSTGRGNQEPFSSRSVPNLDYLSLSNTPCHTEPPSPAGITRTQTPASSASRSALTLGGGGGGGTGSVSASKMAALSPADWEALLGSMEGGLNNVYDAIYGGASLIHEVPVQAHADVAHVAWSADSWDLRGGDGLGIFGRDVGAAPQSVLSLSEESSSSSEEVAPSELGLGGGSADFGKHHVPGVYGFDLEGIAL